MPIDIFLARAIAELVLERERLRAEVVRVENAILALAREYRELP